ncbi:HNH endonuclease [Nocardia ignorata]|uniref:HNH endonuclease n=1 Tax=Nocardia ignorata TaxID=145285 RepID=UPI0036426246
MRRRNTGPSREVIELVRERAGGRCERCAWLLHAGGEIHHRVPRGMGGTRLAWINRPPNLVHICLPCHRWAESYRSSALDTGWLVFRRRNPVEIPIHSVLHGVVLLTDDGRIIPVSQADSADVTPIVTRDSPNVFVEGGAQ